MKYFNFFMFILFVVLIVINNTDAQCAGYKRERSKKFRGFCGGFRKGHCNNVCVVQERASAGCCKKDNRFFNACFCYHCNDKTVRLDCKNLS